MSIENIQGALIVSQLPEESIIHVDSQTTNIMQLKDLIKEEEANEESIDLITIVRLWKETFLPRS